MSHLPPEIILITLKYLVPLLSVEKSLQLRLVNTLFAQEIHLLLFRHPTKDQEKAIQERSRKCPETAIRQYLYSKIHQDPVSRCIFSHHAHEMLNTKLAHTPFSEVPFLERIVDIGCLLVRDYCAAFDASRYDEEMAEYNRKVESDDCYEWEAIGDTALMVLACSAIIRHDVDTLTWAVDSGLQLGKHSKRLLWIPVLVAAAAGNKEIATLVVDRGYQIQEIKLFAKQYVLLEVAAGSNRRDVLEVWLEHLRHIDDEHLQFNVTHLMRQAALGGALPMFDFLSRWFDGNIATLLHDTLIEAMIQVDHSAMAGILKHEGYDRAKFTGKYPKGPIFTVMLAPWDCNSMPLLEVLLNGGLSPDGISPGVNGTPLQRAIEKGRLDIASKLTSYGADVNAYCVPHRMRKRSKVPLLLLAARKRNASMVRLLLDNGADATCVKNDKTHGGFIQKMLDRSEADLASVNIQGCRYPSVL